MLGGLGVMGICRAAGAGFCQARAPAGQNLLGGGGPGDGGTDGLLWLMLRDDFLCTCVGFVSTIVAQRWTAHAFRHKDTAKHDPMLDCRT